MSVTLLDQAHADVLRRAAFTYPDVGRSGGDAPYGCHEPDRQGFAYGTLPGHPESGEEAFVLRRRTDERVDFTVSAFSRPGTGLARLAGPVGRGLQRIATGRYLNSLDG